MIQAAMRQRRFQYLMPPASSKQGNDELYSHYFNVSSPILSVASSVVLNQKYWVSLLSSHSATVTLSSVRGQDDQGSENYSSRK